MLREANEAAHTLATVALNIDDELIWLEETSILIESVIIMDDYSYNNNNSTFYFKNIYIN